MREHKVNGSEGAREGGQGHDVLKKNKNFYIGVGGTVLEGLLSGSLFLLLYSVMQLLWAGQFDLDRVLMYPDLQLWLHQSPDWRRGSQPKYPAVYG